MVGEAVDVRQQPARKVAAAPCFASGTLGNLVSQRRSRGRPGEVVGCHGLAGSGHEDFSAASSARFHSGRCDRLEERPFRPRHPA